MEHGLMRRQAWVDRFPIVMGDTYRHGGVSKVPYESLNLAFHVGDEAQSVRENRAIYCEYLGVEPKPYFLWQSSPWFKGCRNHRRPLLGQVLLEKIRLSMIVMRYLQIYHMCHYFCSLQIALA